MSHPTSPRPKGSRLPTGLSSRGPSRRLLERGRDFRHPLPLGRTGRGGECCDLLVSQPVLVPEHLEGTELIERVQGFAHRVLGQAVLLGDAVRIHEAGHGHVLGQLIKPTSSPPAATWCPAGTGI